MLQTKDDDRPSQWSKCFQSRIRVCHERFPTLSRTECCPIGEWLGDGGITVQYTKPAVQADVYSGSVAGEAVALVSVSA